MDHAMTVRTHYSEIFEPRYTPSGAPTQRNARDLRKQLGHGTVERQHTVLLEEDEEERRGQRLGQGGQVIGRVGRRRTDGSRVARAIGAADPPGGAGKPAFPHTRRQPLFDASGEGRRPGHVEPAAAPIASSTR